MVVPLVGSFHHQFVRGDCAAGHPQAGPPCPLCAKSGHSTLGELATISSVERLHRGCPQYIAIEKNRAPAAMRTMPATEAIPRSSLGVVNFQFIFLDQLELSVD